MTAGTIVYTGMLNAAGGFETDVTVSRLSRDRYFVVSPTSQVSEKLSFLQPLTFRANPAYSYLTRSP